MWLVSCPRVAESRSLRLPTPSIRGEEISLQPPRQEFENIREKGGDYHNENRESKGPRVLSSLSVLLRLSVLQPMVRLLCLSVVAL